MSNCTINLKVGGESIEVTVDSSLLPENLIGLKNILLNNDKWNSLLNNIRGTLKSRKTIKDIELEDLVNSHHLISNGTIANLKARFPSAGFPEDSEDYKISNKKILFVNKYKTKSGLLLYGRVLNKNGQEIFIVDASHVKLLAKYFELLKRIISTSLLNLLDEDISKQLDYIYDKALKLDKLKQALSQYVNQRHLENPEIEDTRLRRESLLILFSQNKSPFRDIVYNFNEESLGAYSFLSELASLILDLKVEKTYSNRLLQDIIKSIHKYSSDFKEAYLDKNYIFNILPKELLLKFIDENLINKDGSASFKKVNEELNKRIKNNKQLFEHIFGKEVVGNYDENIDGWGILIQEILNSDKTFNFNYKSQEKNKITLLKFSSNLQNTFGIGFEDLKKMNEPEYYKGKYILTKENKNGSKKYYVTNYYTTEFLFANEFDTLEKAQYFIENEDSNIMDNSYKFLHIYNVNKNGEFVSNDTNNLVIPTNKYVPKKTILTVLDYDVPSLDLDVIPEEMKGFISFNKDNKKMSDFKKFVDETLETYLPEGNLYTEENKKIILDNIDTPEKVFLFISQLNNPNYINDENTKEKRKIDLSSKREILNLAEEIGSVKDYKYYYVKEYNQKVIKLIPFKENLIKEYRLDRDYPVKNILKAAQKVISPKLGNVKLNILSSEEILEKIEGDYNITAKAFIKDGEIYVNSDLADLEDLFHEYVHILLGYLKFNENTKDLYRKLLEDVWNFEKEDFDRDSIQNTYWDYSLIDLMEEYFALKFGKWIKNNTKSDFSEVFNNNILKEGTKILFDPNNKSKSIKDLYGKKLSDVWLNFNSEIALYLKENKTLDDGEYSNLFTILRKKTQWIRLLIHDGNLIEHDCI